MRINKYYPARASCDPKLQGSYSAFTACYTGGVQYDLYFLNNTFYVVRDYCVGFYTAHGCGFIDGKEGRRLSEDLLKKFPRPGTEAHAQAAP